MLMRKIDFLGCAAIDKSAVNSWLGQSARCRCHKGNEKCHLLLKEWLRESTNSVCSPFTSRWSSYSLAAHLGRTPPDTRGRMYIPAVVVVTFLTSFLARQSKTSFTSAPTLVA